MRAKPVKPQIFTSTVLASVFVFSVRKLLSVMKVASNLVVGELFRFKEQRKFREVKNIKLSEINPDLCFVTTNSRTFWVSTHTEVFVSL